MEVQILRKTERPERLVCQAARGDYYEGYVGDTEYAELMETVSISDTVKEELFDSVEPVPADDISSVSPDGKYEITPDEILEAKTRSFIEKELRRGHYGPFEHPQVTFAVKGVPVFTERQLIRHRHLTFDVQSMRYADFADAPYTVPKSIVSGSLNREDGYTSLDEETKSEARQLYTEHMDEAFDRYEELVEMGVPKEDARGLLGLSTEVNLTVSGNARSFLHLLDMRRKADAQWSIREMSEQMLDELFEWMPHTYNWYKENGPNKLSP
jgi:thymidylate synthase (FAD)